MTQADNYLIGSFLITFWISLVIPRSLGSRHERQRACYPLANHDDEVLITNQVQDAGL